MQLKSPHAPRVWKLILSGTLACLLALTGLSDARTQETPGNPAVRSTGGEATAEDDTSKPAEQQDNETRATRQTDQVTLRASGRVVDAEDQPIADALVLATVSVNDSDRQAQDSSSSFLY